MSKANIAIRYRLYPNNSQKEFFEKSFGCARKIWNLMLNDKIEHYKKCKEPLHTTPAFYKKDFPYLKEVDSLALANVQMELQEAYNSFFRNPRTGFPRFKSKKDRKKSYTTNNQGSTVRIGKGCIRLPKIKEVKAVIHRMPKDGYVLKSVTISRTPTGKYYASVLFEYENQVTEQADMNKSVGLDFSMSSLYIASDGTSADMPSFYRRAEKRLKKAQRRLSKMYVKGKEQSRRYSKQRHRVAVLHEKTANQRKDFLHKLSHRLVMKYDYICIEDLNMKGMSQALNFGKSVHDDGWGMFTQMLEYKAAMNGKHVIRIDRFYPSSQTCHVCGVVDGTKALNIREWDCPICGSHLDRDMNAAINIKNEGLRLAKA